MARKRSIIIACMPKSGSSFLTNTISNLAGFEKGGLVPGCDRREQEIEEHRIISFLDDAAPPRRGFFGRGGRRRSASCFAAHLHLRNSRYVYKMCRKYDIFTVVLCRCLEDVVFSLKDHFTNESTVAPMAYVPPEYFEWDEAKKETFIVEFFIPWYLNFFASWKLDSTAGRMFVWYEDMIEDPETIIGGILQAAGHGSVAKEEISRAITAKPRSRRGNRFNKGVAGRGRNLSEPAVESLTRLLSYYNFPGDPDFRRLTQFVGEDEPPGAADARTAPDAGFV